MAENEPIRMVPDLGDDDHDVTKVWEVDFERLQEALKTLDYRVDVMEPGVSLGAIFDHVPVMFSFDTSGRFLSIRSVWDTGMAPEAAAQSMFAAADGWNREKYFPTVYTITSPTGTVQVCADMIIDTRMGLSDAQLSDDIGVGTSTGINAIEYMQQAASATLGWTPPTGQ